MKKKILIVFGTRPEAIKMAPVVKEFQKHEKKFQTLVCVTAQHREMLDQVLKLFEITPDFDLNLMKKGQDLYDTTSRVMLGMRDIINKVQPHVLFVHGDTTTSMATALAAFYKQIPVAHVEAGLRTYNIYSPWPEEINRQITGRICTYHFAPTQKAKKNLLQENVPEDSIFVTGNTVIDALYIILDRIKSNEGLKLSLVKQLKEKGYQIGDKKQFILVTGHRRENFGKGFTNICEALKQIASKYPDVDIVYPVHLNPNVQNPVNKILGKIRNVYLIDPLEYLPFIYLMSKSFIVLTDSGGIQEEAPSLGKPVLVMRDTTERPEAVDAGTVLLVGTDQIAITTNISKLIEDKQHYERMAKAHNPYGDGNASKLIAYSI